MDKGPSGSSENLNIFSKSCWDISQKDPDKIMTERKSCECMSSCEEPEYNIIYNSEDE